MAANEKRAELFEHGIHTERSDIRAHVSATSRTVYVFKTAEAIAAIERTGPELADACQEGVEGRTASGWRLRIDAVEDLRELRFRSWPRWQELFDARGGGSTSERGALAVECVRELMRIGRFPFWLDVDEVTDREIQIEGTDILVVANKRVQVKADHLAGVTGRLYIQKAERNPLRRY